MLEKENSQVQSVCSLKGQAILLIIYRMLLCRINTVVFAKVKYTLRSASASLSTLFARVNSSFLWGFCSICRYKFIWKRAEASFKTKASLVFLWELESVKQKTQKINITKYRYYQARPLHTCSVINTEKFLYFLFILVPSVIKRRR